MSCQHPLHEHLPAYCCCHVFTPACPVDCLEVVLSVATFHTLLRAERASFDRPATVGEVLDLWRAGQLRQIGGLGPRRLGEIETALVVAGLALHDVNSPGGDLPPAPGNDPARFGDEENSP